MKKIFSLIAFVLSFVVSQSQTFTPIHNYQAPDGLDVAKFLGIPYASTPTLNGISRAGAHPIFYATSDSSVYVYTGTQWRKISSSGGGGSTGLDSLHISRDSLFQCKAGTCTFVLKKDSTIIYTDSTMYKDTTTNPGYYTIGVKRKQFDRLNHWDLDSTGGTFNGAVWAADSINKKWVLVRLPVYPFPGPYYLPYNGDPTYYLGGDTLLHLLPTSSGGNTNSNIGSGFRLAVPNTNNVKTIVNGYATGIDSTSNTNALTFKIDTTLLLTKLAAAGLYQPIGSYLTTVDTTNISNFSVKVRSLFNATSPIVYSNGNIRFDTTVIHTSAYNNGLYYPLTGGNLNTGSYIGMPWVNSGSVPTPSGSYTNLYMDSLGRVSHKTSTGNIKTWSMRFPANQLWYFPYRNVGGTLSDSTRTDSLIALKQNLITLTTTGTGASTFNQSTGALNIPQYSGGVTSVTRQVITSGSSGTVTGGNYLVNIDPSSTIASYTLTLPASPSDLQTVEIQFGGTLTSGLIVTSLTVSPNSGQTILDNTPPGSATADDTIYYTYRTSNTKWYRRKL